MKFEYFWLTDTGQVRQNNEDAVAIDSGNQIAVLADGMGGYNAGEVAAAMATTFVTSELGRWIAEGGSQTSGRELGRAMEICVTNANRAVFDAASTHLPYAGMGTTLVVCVFQNARALVGHVGDSRCYRLRHGILMPLTRDHSLLQEQIDAGLLSPEQAPFFAHKNLVTRALGVQETVLLEVSEYRAEEGDLYLMCSDGLNDMVSDERIAAILVPAGTLAEKCQTLVDVANGLGGRDNISVILIQAQSQPMRQGFLSRMLGQ
jgi:protein phosphatase